MSIVPTKMTLYFAFLVWNIFDTVCIINGVSMNLFDVFIRSSCRSSWSKLGHKMSPLSVVFPAKMDLNISEKPRIPAINEVECI